MAKKAYVGVNGIAKNVSKMYVGVNGTPKKVLKGYVGVNGAPKLFFDASASQVGSWDFWKSVSGILFTSGNSNVVKVNNKIAYYGAIWLGNWLSPILMSPDSDAVTFNVLGTIHKSSGTITDSNNITWYYSASQGSITGTPSVDCMVSDTHYSNASDAAQDLLDKIYAVPFHEDYQVGQEYRIPVYSEPRKTIRKIVGWQLAQNVGQYSSSVSYRTWSDNIDSTINIIIANINQHNNSSGMIIAQTISDTDYGEYELFVMHGHFQTGYLPPKINYLDRAKILSSQQGQGNTHKLLEYYYGTPEGQYNWETYYVNAGLMEWQISAKVYSDEPTVIDFQDDDAALSSIWWNEAFIGAFSWDRQNRIDNVVITNIGIDL